MIRVSEVHLEGYDETVKIRSLTCGEAKQYVKESREMLAHKDEIPGDAWFERVVRVVESCTVSPEEISNQIDMRAMNELHTKILEFSGLRSGEATAV